MSPFFPSGGTGNSNINVTYVHEGGSIDMQSGTVVLNGPVQISEGATLLKTGGGALNVWGVQTHGAYSSIHEAGGSLTLFTDAGPAYPAAPTTGLKASGGAAVVLEVGQHLTSLHAGASSLVTLSAGGDKLLRTSTLSFDGAPAAPQGKLDLADNAMIVDGGVLDDVKPVEILRAMGYGVGIELTAMSVRVVPEPGMGVAAMLAAGLLGRRRR